MAQVFVARRDVVQVPFGGTGGIGFEHEYRALREVVEQRRGAWRVGAGRPVPEEERQVVLDALGDDAGAHVLVDAALADVGVEGAVPSVAEAGDAGGVHGDFPRWQDAHLRGFGVGALGVGVEQAQGVDFVVEQVDAHRIGRTHGKYVQERTTDGELAAFGNRVGCAVAGRNQALALGGDVELLPDFEQQRLALHEARRRQALQQRGRRHHQDAVRGLRQREERRQAFGDDVLVRGEVVVGQDFPVREREHRQFRPGEEAESRCAPGTPPRCSRRRRPRDARRRRHPRRGKAAGTAEQPLPIVQQARCRGFRRGGKSHSDILHARGAPSRSPAKGFLHRRGVALLAHRVHVSDKPTKAPLRYT